MNIWTVLIAAVIGFAVGLGLQVMDQPSGMTIIKMGIRP